MYCSLFKVRYRTDLYEWGKGWLDKDKAKRWRLFLIDFKNEHWRVIYPEFIGDSFRLASVYSSVYLHPMIGLLTLHDEKEVEQIRGILTSLCKAAGGTLTQFSVQEINYELEI